MTDVSALVLGMNKSRQQEDSIKLAILSNPVSPNRFKMEEGCRYIGTLLISDSNLWLMLVMKNLRLHRFGRRTVLRPLAPANYSVDDCTCKWVETIYYYLDDVSLCFSITSLDQDADV